MRRSILTASLSAIAVLSLSLPLPLPGALQAQRAPAAPKRPRLGADADTNDARAYLDLGKRVASIDPAGAADAFYWAGRIDPSLADAHYGRCISLIMDRDGLLRELMNQGRSKRSRELVALDSLQLRALMLNPFLFRQLDVTLLKTYWRKEIQREARQEGGNQPMTGEIDHVLDSWLQQAGPYMRGWVSYGAGDFDGALRYYSQALKSTKEKADLHVERGRIFGMRAEADSAIAEFRQALTEQRKRDAKDVVVVYNSKAVLEQAIGVLLEQQDSVVGAREAYGRALQEDLAYWPAHVRLGQLAITLKDTATAVSELTLAAQIAPKEGYVRALVGSSLAMLGKVDEAVTELTKAIELEPYYAMPHVMLGRIYDQAGFHDEAAASYAQFLAHASRHDPQREFAEQRAAALKAATP